MLAPQMPGTAPPAQSVLADEGQSVADDGTERSAEDAGQTLSFELVVQPRIERIYVHGQSAFTPEVVPNVFVARLYVRRPHP